MICLGIYSLLLLLISQCQAQVCDVSKTPVSTENVEQLPATGNNHLYIAGFFDVHQADRNPYKCGPKINKGIQMLEAFFWAIRTFRARHNQPGGEELLKGVDVGAIAWDTCSRPHQAVQIIFNLEKCSLTYGSQPVNPNNVVTYIGPTTTSVAREAAFILGHMNKTLISPTVKGEPLSSVSRYPYFLRIQPSDVNLIKAIMALIEDRMWQYVQVVYSDNADGKGLLSLIKMSAKSSGLCIVQELPIVSFADDSQMHATVDNMKNRRDTSVVVVLTSTADTTKLIQAIMRKKAGGIFTLIGTTEWGKRMSVVKGAEKDVIGSITFDVNSDTTWYGNFMGYFRTLKPNSNNQSTFFNQFWEEEFNCNVQNPGKANRLPCDINTQSFSRMEIDTDVISVIQAVDVTIFGLHKARKQLCPQVNTGLCNAMFNSMTRHVSIYNGIKSVDSVAGVQFNQVTGNNQLMAYTISNFSQSLCTSGINCYSRLGTYENNQLTLSSWKTIPTPTCTIDCNVCNGYLTTKAPVVTSGSQISTSSSTNGQVGGNVQPLLQEGQMSGIRGDWVIALMVLAGLGMIVVLAFEGFLLFKVCASKQFRNWRTLWLGQLLLMGIFLCYLVCFAFVPVPTPESCGIIRFGVGVSVGLCFAVLLVKLMVIFSSKKYGYLGGVFQVLMLMFAWGVQIVIDISWLLHAPTGVIYGVNLLHCQFMFEYHILSLVYIMFLILVCGIISIMTYRIITNYREGVFIGITCGFVALVWIIWTLVGAFINNRDHQDAATAFGLWATATVILFTMFLPKVRQLQTMGVEGIYVEDETKSVKSLRSVSHIEAMAYNNNGNGSVHSIPVIAPPSYRSLQRPDSALYVSTNPNLHGTHGMYADLPSPDRLSLQSDTNALYLRHPGSRSESMRSGPVYGGSFLYSTNGRPRTRSEHGGPTLLRIKGEPVYEHRKRAQSEAGYPIHREPLYEKRRTNSEVDYPIHLSPRRPEERRRTKSFSELGP